MHIIVSKFGSVFWTEPKSANGEMGETMGMIRHLAKSHKVTYVGQVNGELPEGIGHANINFDGLSQESHGDDIIAATQGALAQCHDAQAMIVMSGPATTRAWPTNPRGTRVQGSSVRYTAPQLYLAHALEIPIFSIVSDPRNYPKYMDMVDQWPDVKPKAMLSQRDRTWPRTIAGVRHTCREVYSACETWCYRPKVEAKKTLDSVCIAHPHITTGIACGITRRQAWAEFLSPIDELYEMGLRVYGDGWNMEPEAMFPGKVTPARVDELLASSYSCPIMAHEHMFYTGKLACVLNQDCAPLLWSKGRYTYDPLFKYVEKEHPLRVNRPGGLKRVIKLAKTFDLSELQDRVKPNFVMLDNMLSDFEDGESCTSDSWFKKYGGIR